MAPIRPPDDQRRSTESPNRLAPGTPGEPIVSNGSSQGSSTLNQPIPSAGSGPQLVTQDAPKPPSSAAIWIDRLGLVIRVVFYIELGMLLAVLPWTRLWTNNSLVMDFPRLNGILQMNFVRGLVTGIGLVDIWIGVWEAVRYRERK